MGSNPKSLAHQECIVNSSTPEWNEWTFSNEKGDLRVEVKGKYSTNFYGAIRALCLSHLGIARMPYYVVKDDLASGALVQLFPEYQISTHPLYLVYLRSEYTTQKHKIMREALLKWFGNWKEIFV